MRSIGICRGTAWLAAATLLATPAHSQTPIPAAPSVNAAAHILMDFHSGGVLAEHSADERMEPASLTKLMTAYAVFRALEEGTVALGDTVTVSERAWRTGGSRMFIEVGSQVAVAELLQGMIVQSGNDASIALAEHVAGTEETFARLMNEYAGELGMRSSHFTNPTGLPEPEHYTSARDVAMLARAIIGGFPDYYRWYSQREYAYNGITQHNRNSLLWRDPSVDGVKTGHTASAGYCLVTSALRDGMRLISVVLGSSTAKARENASQALLTYGFRFYQTHRLYEAGENIATPRVWKGQLEEVPIGLNEALYITIPRGRYEELEAEIDLASTLEAPLDPGTAVGEVRVRLGELAIASQPVFPLQPVARAGLWGRLVDSVLLWFE